MTERVRTPWRDNIEAMTTAIIMALLLKHFIVDAYKIPTGSMQPTLIGDRNASIFDRILVDKLSYRLRDPQRWEIAIFRYPLDRSKNFVKRIVGVGPEEFRILHGDLWHRRDADESWQVLRRPRSVQSSAWKELAPRDPEDPTWHATTGGERWSFGPRSVAARGDGRARFRPELGDIRDRYLDGYGESLKPYFSDRNSASGVNAVDDLRVDGRVRALGGALAVAVELDQDEERFRFVLPGPAAPEGALPRIESWNTRIGESSLMTLAAGPAPWRLAADGWTEFRVQNMDDLLELEIDGRTICTAEIEPCLAPRSTAFVKVAGEGADLEDLMVYRDIYYTASLSGGSQIDIPANCYFVLGDNTQDSSDSREWTLARFIVPGDDGAERILRGNLRRGENPRVSNDWAADGGPVTRFVDEWGEIHWFENGAAEQISPDASPFVPREAIQGRALAVFWPLDPVRDIYRLGWVH